MAFFQGDGGAPVTGGNDFIFGTGPDDIIAGGSGGSDFLIGGFNTGGVFSGVLGNDSVLTAFSLEVDTRWIADDRYSFIEAGAPSTTIHIAGENTVEFYSVSVGANETITVDVDFATFNSFIQLIGPDGTSVLASNDDAAGDIGSINTTDSFLTFTTGAAGAGTYFVVIGSSDGGAISSLGASDEALLNVTVSGHAATGVVINSDDELRGGGGEDIVYGGDGNDELHGGGSNDRVEGGNGDDTLFGGGGNDLLIGGDGTDTANYQFEGTSVTVDLALGTSTSIGNSGNDTLVSIENIVGSSASDVLTGDANDNVIEGRNGNDTLNGGAGNDTLNGESGNDTLNGGAGDDTLFGGTGNDVFIGGDGTDTAVFGGRNLADMQIFIDENGDFLLIDQFGDEDRLTGIEFVQFQDQTLTIAELEALSGTIIFGTEGDDVLDGTAGDNNVNGLGGNDTITGLAGDDLLLGGSGNDLFIWSTGDGSDTIDGGDGFDTLDTSGDGSDQFISLLSGTGTIGSDILTLSNVESVMTGAGNDRVETNSSFIVYDIRTGVGDDEVVKFSTTGSDTISEFDAGDGTDTFIYDQPGFTNSNAGTEVNLAEGKITFNGGDRDTVTNFENVTLIDVAGSIVGDDGDNVLIAVGDRENTIEGGAGNDTVDGGAGDDTLVLSGNAQDYTFTDNGGGTFTIADTAGTDGTDIVSNFEFIQFANISIEFQTLVDGAEFLTEGVDEFVGSVEDDIIFALGGDDTVSGLAGDDIINGGSGDDILIGGAGADVLDGGDGFDTASYFNASEGVSIDKNGVGGQGEALGDTLISIERFVGSAFDDRVEFDTGTLRLRTFEGGAGNDTLDIDGTNGQLAESFGFFGGEGNDLLLLRTSLDDNGTTFADSVIDGGEGFDRINIGRGGELDFRPLEFASIERFTFAGNVESYFLFFTAEQFSSVENVETGRRGALEVYIDMGETTELSLAALATSGANSTPNDFFITGDDDAEIITGSNRGDVIAGNGGADTLDGGDNIDTLSYAGSALGVTINLATGVASGGDAEGDIISNFENIIGSSFDDTLTGDAGDNIIEGGAGADVLDGGDGVNTLSYEGSVEGVTVNFREGTATGGDASSGGVDDTITGFESFIGGSGNDTVTAAFGSSALVFTFEGRAGNDTFFFTNAGFFGDVDGGADIDTIDFSAYIFSGLNVNLETGLFDIIAPEDEHTIVNVENINGSGLDDVLTGDAGVNVINAGEGDDIVSGGAGDDTIRGGSGIDTIVVAGNFADYTISDIGGGQFQIVDSAGTDGIDTLVSIERVQYADGTIAFGVSGDDIDLSEENDVFTATAANETINALAGNDLVNAGAGDDIVNGGDGNDNLRGDAGDDMLFGGFGVDILRGGAGADTLNGGAGADVADYSTSGGAVGVTVNLTTGVNTGGDAEGDVLILIDRVTGSSRADDITGSTRSNYLRGLANDDVLTGVSGINFLQGDTGADTLIGGTGEDWAFYISSNDGLTVNLGNAALNTGEAIGDTYSSIENILGSNFADNITGDAAGNFIRGANGDDMLFGGGGDDFLRGDAGADVLDGGGGNDFAYYANNAVAVTIDLGANTASGGDATGDSFISIERVFGSSFADSITGDNGANYLRGFFGSDTLTGGDGDDFLQGDSGADTLDGGSGSDWAFYVSSRTALTIDLGTTSNNTGEASGDSYVSIENVFGSKFDDIITGDSGANTLRGFSGDDTLNGGAGDDTLRGEAGADIFVFESGGGNDTVIDWVDADDFLDLSDFGFATFAAAMATAAQIGSDVVFTIGNDIIAIEDTTTAEIADNLII